MMQKLSGFTTNLGLGIALACGVVYSSHLVTRSMERIRGTVEVKGYAERLLKSDTAVWNLTLTVRHGDLKEANKQMESQRNQTTQFLKEHKIKDSNLTVNPPNVEVRYERDDKGNETSKIGQYIVTQTLAIESNDVELISKLPHEISPLINQGIEINSRAPDYFLNRSKLDQTKIELLAEATRSAKERADQFANNSDTKIGRLVSARQGVFQVTAENSTETSDWGTYDTSSINKIVKIVVTLAYTTGS